MIFDNNAETSNVEKTDFLTNGARKTGYPHAKESITIHHIQKSCQNGSNA